MRPLSDIQNKVRVYTNDSVLVLTDNTTDKNKGLDISNEVYLKLSSLYKWPEFNRIDTSITTSPYVSSYDWPSTPKFTNILNVELFNSSSEYEIIPMVKDELDWNYFSYNNSNFPCVYRLESVGSQKKITFAPSPNSAMNIRIRGTVEPDKFINGESTTIFDSQISDNVLEYMISASFLFKRNFIDRAITRVNQASSLLSSYLGKEISPSELDPRAAVSGGQING